MKRQFLAKPFPWGVEYHALVTVASTTVSIISYLSRHLPQSNVHEWVVDGEISAIKIDNWSTISLSTLSASPEIFFSRELCIIF